MAWLVRGGTVLASVEVAGSRAERRRGLIGRDGVDGALLLEPACWIHTARVRFAIDAAYLRSTDGEKAGGAAGTATEPEARAYVVDAVATYRPWRLGKPRPRCSAVLEAEAGSFDRWGLEVGDEVEVVHAAHPQGAVGDGEGDQL